MISRPRYRYCYHPFENCYHIFHNICIYSYEQCLGTSHITVALQLLFSRGWEWQNRCPVFVFNGDIKAAFIICVLMQLRLGFELADCTRDLLQP